MIPEEGGDFFRTDPRVLEVASFFTPPPGIRTDRRLPHTTSRIAILKDGERPIPVLVLLARMRFGAYDQRVLFPFWADGNPRNEMLGNVELAKRAKAPDVLVGHVRRRPRRRQWDVP